MKKFLVVFLLCLILGFSSTVSFAALVYNININNKHVGLYYNIRGDQIEIQSEFSDYNINQNNQVIKGTIGEVNFSVDKYKSEKDVDYFKGKAQYGNQSLNMNIVKNSYGLSGIVFNDKKDVIKAFIISDKQKVNEIKKNVKNINLSIQNNKKSYGNLNKGTIIVPNTYYQDNQLHIFKSALYIPFILSGGTVEGTLYYTVASNVPDGMRFYFDRLYGYIDWASGFDGIMITNENEPYGVFWGTPSWPSRNIQTWYINQGAYKSGNYYLKATVSYTLLINNVPVLFWDSDQKLIQ
ncbi:MAG: hypothetical protein IMW84_01070 [Thermoanaerobacter sp.]|nr:hypothetical protein [Thermoanaerobacter sp.]